MWGFMVHNNKLIMQAELYDDKVIQSLLDDADENIMRVEDNNAFILQSQEINRWDGGTFNNQYFKRLSAESFRPRQSCVLPNTAREKSNGGVAIIIKHLEQKPFVISQAPKLFGSSPPPRRVEKSLPHSQYLMPRKTYTPPLAPKLICNMQKPEKKKGKLKSKSIQWHPKLQSSASCEKQIGPVFNLPYAPQFPQPNKKPYRVRVSNFSFDQPSRQELLIEKNEREMIEHMKHEALLKRLKYQPFQQKIPDCDNKNLLKQKQKVQNHMMHYFRTKKLMRNKKLELIM